MRRIGQAYHCGDLARGVRHHGKRMASDTPPPIDPIRSIAPQEGRSQTCLERLETAQRVGPTMQATIECVSRDVRQQVRPRALTQPASYARPAQLSPSYYLDRVAATTPSRAGQVLQERAARIRPPLFEPGGVVRAWNP